MGNYLIKIEEVNSWVMEVEAEDEHEASDMGYEMYANGDLEYQISDVSVTVEY